MDAQMVFIGQPIIALLAGLLILFVPRVLNLVIALYLILVGLIGLFPHVFGTGTVGG